MPRYDVFLEGRTESSTCYFGVAVMADDQKEAEYLGHEAGRKKHRECDEIEVVGVMPVISARNAGKGRLCQRIPEIMPEGLQTIDRAIGTYGKDAQLTKAVEEMSELTKALCKLKVCKLKYDTPFNREMQEVYSNIEEETADVFIMLVQLFVIFNPHELVNITKIVWDKLDRLKDNLDKEAAKQEGCKDDTPEC